MRECVNKQMARRSSVPNERPGIVRERESQVGTERIDRRVRRTRELVTDALITLIEERGYERVTVQDIIDRADVGRSTFYAHFRDKEELLLSAFDDLRAAFEGYEQQLGGDHAGHKGPWPTLALFEHASEYPELYKAMVGKRGADVVRRHLHTLLSELMLDHFRARAPGGDTRVPMEVIVEAAVSALLGLLVWWLENERPYSSAEILRMYEVLTKSGFSSALRPRRA
jgi:AcrR family transcriptional regulator